MWNSNVQEKARQRLRRLPPLPTPRSTSLKGSICFTRAEKRERKSNIWPALVRQAFLLEPTDSGWLMTETVRWGVCGRGDYVVNFYAPARYELLMRSDDGQK